MAHNVGPCNSCLPKKMNTVRNETPITAHRTKPTISMVTRAWFRPKGYMAGPIPGTAKAQARAKALAISSHQAIDARWGVKGAPGRRQRRRPT